MNVKFSASERRGLVRIYINQLRRTSFRDLTIFTTGPNTHVTVFESLLTKGSIRIARSEMVLTPAGARAAKKFLREYRSKVR